MSETRILQKKSITALLERLLASNLRVLAPLSDTDGQVSFQLMNQPLKAEAIDLRTMSPVSPKTALFPLVEEVLRYTTGPSGIKIEGERPESPQTVLFGIRPCDARAFLSLDAVMLTGYLDAFYKARRDATTLVAVSCSTADSECFCTSVGGGPGDPAGSDLLLTELADGRFLVEVITEKGARLISLAPDLFEACESPVDKQAALADVPARFTREQVEGRLKALFNDEAFWTNESLRCLGCGACAFVCPVCSCFDLQDEGDLHGGARLRSWDSCGQRLFTLHASGHNPRTRQSQRRRQRIMHKFSYMPERQAILGCVGCGRCSRACPVDMSLNETLVMVGGAQS